MASVDYAVPATQASRSCVVKFGDVVRNVDVVERAPLETGLDRYVGLEHLDPASLHIRRWGLIEDGTSFTRRFSTGQVLFGKRRAYQRKVAVAQFDGICSGDILVFEPANERLLPGLLPFIVQSEGFFQHALGTSAGSLSPRAKWRDLANYEFPLPPLGEQRRIVELLWVVDEVREAWRSVLEAIDAALRAYRHSVFRESQLWPRVPLESLFDVQLGKMLSPAARRGSNPRPYLGYSNVQWGRLDLDHLPVMDFDEDDMAKFRLQNGDILACEGRDVGRSAVWRDEMAECYYQKALHRLRPKRTAMQSTFIIHFLYYASRAGLLSGLTAVSTIPHLTAVRLRSLRVPLPPLAVQDAIVRCLDQFDRNNRIVQQHLDNLLRLGEQLTNELLADAAHL